MNLYHRAMLFWSFQRGLEGFKYDLTHYSDEDMPGSISWIKRYVSYVSWKYMATYINMNIFQIFFNQAELYSNFISLGKKKRKELRSLLASCKILLNGR